jgi:hypothetical protein
MENTNKKIVAVSLLLFSAVSGFTLHLLMVILGGTIGFFTGLADSSNVVAKGFGCFSHIIANETNTLISMLQKYNETRDPNLAKHIVHKAKWIGYMLNNKL